MMALYFYFNETTGDLVYSDQATYSGSGYTSLGQQTKTNPMSSSDWIFHSKRASIKTVTSDPNLSGPINILTSMDLMFMGCTALISLDLGGFNTLSVTSMISIFNGCNSLASLDLNGFDMSNVTDANYMFYGCTALISLDLSSFDMSNVTSYGGMFNNCSALRIIDISPNMSKALSLLPASTYYDAFTRQAYAKADIPGGSTYVRDLADLDLVATMVQSRAGIKAMEHRVNSHIDELQRQLDALTA